MQEVWKDVAGYEGYYQVSNMGKVRSVDRKVRHSGTFTRIAYGKTLRQKTSSTGGYCTVGLRRDGHDPEQKKVHRLVAIAFIPNPDNLPEVNHIDEDKTNNCVANLEWVTHKQNENHGTKQIRKVAHTDYSVIAKKNSKKVIQYDRNMNEIKVWDSLAAIHKELGYSQGNISMACNGKYSRALYGCFWRWA